MTTAGSELAGNPTPYTDDKYWIFVAFKCSVCNAQSIATGGVSAGAVGSVGGGLNGYADEMTGSGLAWFPAAGETQVYPDVPDHIAGAATEAFECASQKHNRAAVLLCRSVIEATAKEKNITAGKLFNKIEELEKQGFIRLHLKEAAHTVREFGNDMAHGDFVDPISDEDTQLVIELMAEILNEVFQSPAKIKRAQAAALARKQ